MNKLYYIEFIDYFGERNNKFVLGTDLGLFVLKDGTDEISLVFDSFKSLVKFFKNKEHSIVELE